MRGGGWMLIANQYTAIGRVGSGKEVELWQNIGEMMIREGVGGEHDYRYSTL